MRLLFLGYSSIARRRVIPALASLREVREISVASRSRAASIELPAGKQGTIYTDFDEALADQQADLVYVSTVNSEHEFWVERALRLGYHTIVDKPAFLSLEKSQQLVALASAQRRCLAEANVYGYHPQVETIRQVFERVGDRVTHLSATFSVPPLPASDFRYQAALGGGALWDHGPYAVSPGRLFFGSELAEITVSAGGWRGEVETAFSLLATYASGEVLVGHFGFTTAYRNALELLGPQTAVTVERIFTTPDEMANELRVTQNNQKECVTVPPASAFGLFIQAVIQAILRKEYSQFTTALLSDAAALARLRAASDQAKFRSVS